jgi:type IV pilus assembly protein PilA
MKSMQKGFTLIELMIVVAIIAILAAIAIPAYENYLIRTQVTEGVTLMDGAKVAAEEFYSNKGYFPLANQSAGLAAPGSITGKYVASVTVVGGGTGTTGADPVNITSVFNTTGANTAIQGKNVILQGSVPANQENVVWTCNETTTGASVDPKYLPSSCR